MKKLLALMLTAALALSLVGCGGDGGTSDDTAASGTPAPAQESETPAPAEEEKTIPGTYAPVGMVPGDVYELNENGSYDYGEEKGTYTADGDGNSITFQPKDGNSRTLTACGAYYHTGAKMAEDTEYGLSPSFDGSGHSNQTFQVEANGTSLTLELHEDGSYVFSYSRTSPAFNKFFDTVTFEGSYSLEDTVLSLSWQGSTFPFLFADGAIYPIVYAKEDDGNRGDMEVARAAVLAAEEEAAQERWWTPADEATAAAVTEALAGTWEYTDGYGVYQLTFSDTSVSVYMGFLGQTALSSTGTYSIQNGAVLLEYKSQSGSYTIINHRAAPYTYADGSLVLYEMLDMMNEEGLLDPAADITAISEYQYQKTE